MGVIDRTGDATHRLHEFIKHLCNERLSGDLNLPIHGNTPHSHPFATQKPPPQPVALSAILSKAEDCSRLSAADQAIPTSDFKNKFPELRNTMKTTTLGIIYGLTPAGLALRLAASKSDASRLLEDFMKLFPKLAEQLQFIVSTSLVRGFSTTVTGLRRHRPNNGPVTPHDRNWMRNHPIQGSAGDAFKVACNRLYALYKSTTTKLILPVHDAVVFECPSEQLQSVAELTCQTLCRTVQEFFPVLRPRAEYNIDHPNSWNKEGKPELFTNWLESTRDVDGG